MRPTEHEELSQSVTSPCTVACDQPTHAQESRGDRAAPVVDDDLPMPRACGSHGGSGDWGPPLPVAATVEEVVIAGAVVLAVVPARSVDVRFV